MLDGYGDTYSPEDRARATECLTAAVCAQRVARAVLADTIRTGPLGMDLDEFDNAVDAWAQELA